MGFGRRVRRTRQGDFEIRLADGERALLRAVGPQLRDLLERDPDDPDLRRLFPAAYAGDPERDAEYRRMVHDDLLARRREALATLLATAEATRLSEEEVLAWIGAVNDLRLWLGTALDVSEDMDLDDPAHPDAAWLALYGYLGYLLEQLVGAVADG